MRWDWPQLHPKRFNVNLKDVMGLIPKRLNVLLIDCECLSCFLGSISSVVKDHKLPFSSAPKRPFVGKEEKLPQFCKKKSLMDNWIYLYRGNCCIESPDSKRLLFSTKILGHFLQPLSFDVIKILFHVKISYSSPPHEVIFF